VGSRYNIELLAWIAVGVVLGPSHVSTEPPPPIDPSYTVLRLSIAPRLENADGSGANQFHSPLIPCEGFPSGGNIS
jgi:hypothetical protein